MTSRKPALRSAWSFQHRLRLQPSGRRGDLLVGNERSVPGRDIPGEQPPHPGEQHEEGTAAASGPSSRNGRMIAVLTVRSSGMAS